MSNPSPNLKTVNIRLDEDLWSSCKAIALERHQSFNKLAEEALANAASEYRRSKVRTAFEQLAAQGEGVEFAFESQAEVVLGNHVPPAS